MSLDHYYPRKGNIPSPMVYTTIDKHGDVLHTKYGGQPNLGGCRTGCGTWWPDFGPTVRDFSPGGINHPTEFVFQREVASCVQRANSEPKKPKPPMAQPFRKSHFDIEDEKPAQFRHPQPQREALMKSVGNMPYKSGGRRKCAEASNWKSCLSSGAEGMTHGGRYPIWAKGPLLEDPDSWQRHPLVRHEKEIGIHASFKAENMPAGSATGTNTLATLVLSPKSAGDLGLRDSTKLRRDMTSTDAIDATSSFRASVNRLPVNMSGKTRRSSSLMSLGSEAASDMPNWVAPQTMATRDYTAAGHGGTGSTRRLYQGKET